MYRQLAIIDHAVVKIRKMGDRLTRLILIRVS